MARTPWPTVLSGDSWSASQHNTYGRDNDLAYWVYTTAGDLAYATSSSALARLALTTGGLLHGGASAPEWLAPGAAYQMLRTNSGGTDVEWDQAPFVTAEKYDGTGHTYGTNTWRDMPNSSGTITPLVTSTILAIGIVDAYGGSTYGGREFLFSIAGSEITNFISQEWYALSELQPTVIIGRKTGVAAGAQTILIREKSPAGNYTVSNLKWIALAVPE